MKCYVCGRSESDFEELLAIEASKKTDALNNLRTQITNEKATYEASRKKFIELTRGQTPVAPLERLVFR